MNDPKRSQLFCDHYKGPGYTIEKCFKIHSYPNSLLAVEEVAIHTIKIE